MNKINALLALIKAGGASIVGYVGGHIAVYATNLGSIGGALPADTKIFVAFGAFAYVLVDDIKAMIAEAKKK